VQLRKHREFERSFPTDGVSRPIGDVPRFPAFDGLRAFAAVSVVAVHTAFFSGFSLHSSLGNYTSRLEIGVSVFFVISGFLLYRPFVVAHLKDQSAPKAAKFWIRRVFRIVPAYWLALTVLAYVLHLVTLSEGWRGTAAQYLFLQIYFPTTYFYGINGAWSLCVEMSFYFFLPLYAWVITYRSRGLEGRLRRELCGLLTMIAISFAYRSWVLSHHPTCGTHCLTSPAVTSIMGTWLPTFLDLFALGMFLAVISAWFAQHDGEPPWLRHRSMPWVSWGLAGVAFWSVSHLGISPQPDVGATPEITVLKQTLYGLFALFLVAPAVFGPQGEGAIRRALRFSPVAWLGVVSYGIYLWHAALIAEFFRVTGKPEFAVPFWVLFVTVLCAATFVATLSYLGFEQPFLEYANRLTRRKTAVTATSNAAGPAIDQRPARHASPTNRPRVLPRGAALSAVATSWRSWRASFEARWFLPGLLVVVVLAVAVRIAFAAGWTFGRPLFGDATFFHQAAASLAAGHGYATTSLVPPHGVLPTAQHPPLFSSVLAGFDLLGFHSVDAQRVLLGVVASIAVFLIGLVGHRVAGPSAGLVAAGIAALDPLWFQPSAALMSESIYLVVVSAVLLLALRCLDRASRWRFVLLGAGVGLAVLTRGDALPLVLFLCVPVVLYATRSGRQRLSLARCLLAGLALVLGPWLLRNEVQLGGLALSDNQGSTLAGSYCPPTMRSSSSEYGGFDGTCAEAAAAYVIDKAPPPAGTRSWNELTVSNSLTNATESYIRGHLSALPALAWARVENTWGLARTNQQSYIAQIEGNIASFERFGLELGRVLLVFELIGAVVISRRSRGRFFVLLAPLLAVTLNAALFYGSTRFLTLALPALAVLAAIGTVSTVEVIVHRLHRQPLHREFEQMDVLLELAEAEAPESATVVASSLGADDSVG
jgi:peptidoglycan/LPS O-acetylase OafA/YrhL/4-amino-4-deoxy-L-arabinose transferase-like glycosyltransferase